MLLSWTTLNPMKLVRAMGAFSPYFDFRSFEEYMRRVSDGGRGHAKSREFFNPGKGK